MIDFVLLDPKPNTQTPKPRILNQGLGAALSGLRHKPDKLHPAELEKFDRRNYMVLLDGRNY